VVFHQGDPADSLHLIVKGHFAVRILTPLGHTAMLAVHGPGEAFGELALLSEGASRSATVSALEASETFSVVRGEFFRVCHRHPGVKDVLLALLAQQIRRANERIVVAHYLDADARVRWALLQLVAAYETGAGETVSRSRRSNSRRSPARHDRPSIACCATRSGSSRSPWSAAGYGFGRRTGSGSGCAGCRGSDWGQGAQPADARHAPRA
jgi:CRP-like cAMP-binding protein